MRNNNMNIKKSINAALSVPLFVIGVLLAFQAFYKYYNQAGSSGDILNDMSAFTYVASSFFAITVSTLIASKVSFFQNTALKATYKYTLVLLAFLFCAHLLYSSLLFFGVIHG